MKRILALILLIAMVISVSGCTGDGSFAGINFMGTGSEEKAPVDVIEVSNKRTVPTPPIPADNEFDFLFNLKNLYEEGKARDVEVRLYDYGRCELEDNYATDASSAIVNRMDVEKEVVEEQFYNIDDMYAGSTKVLKWKMEAPTNKELGQIENECKLRFRADYKFDAHTRTDMIVASQEAVDQASKRDDQLTASPSLTQSRGPLKVEVNFGGSQPFLVGKNIPFDVVLVNEGDGEIGEVRHDDVEINMNYNDFDSSSCQGKNDTNCCVYPEGREGEEDRMFFVQGESTPIRCRANISSLASGPTKEYHVNVDVEDYSYRIFDEHSVSIKPNYEAR